MGRVFKPEYEFADEDGKTHKRRTDWYHVEYTDALGRTRRRKAAPTRALAEEILRKREADVAREREGLPTQNAAEILVADLQKRYLAAQKGRVAEKHLEILGPRLNAVAAGIKAITVRDLTPERMDAYLAALEAKASQPAPKTVNGYLQAVKGMLNWAVSMRILPFNPVACLKPRPGWETRRNRRALTQEEVDRLLQVAPTGPLVRLRKAYKGGLIPPEGEARMLDEGENNALAWRMFVYTGLRAGELRALLWGDLDLKAGTLAVRKETAKSRKSAVLPIHPSLGEALARRHQNVQPSPESPVVTLPVHAARILRGDLTLAGIEAKDGADRIVDCHALRHTFGTLICRYTDPKTLADLMRHSSPTISYGIYVHGSQARMREAMGQLPAPRQAPTREANRAVALRDGTTGQPISVEGTPRFRQGLTLDRPKLWYPQGESNPCPQAENLVS